MHDSKVAILAENKAVSFLNYNIKSFNEGHPEEKIEPDEILNLKNDLVLYKWDWTSWNTDWIQIEMLMVLLKCLDNRGSKKEDIGWGYKFIRIGEDLDDAVETKSNLRADEAMEMASFSATRDFYIPDNLISHKCMLVSTDGYSIENTIYSSYEEAKSAMEKAYDEVTPDDWNEMWQQDSYLAENNAILYANGENVFVWQIVDLNE